MSTAASAAATKKPAAARASKAAPVTAAPVVSAPAPAPVPAPVLADTAAAPVAAAVTHDSAAREELVQSIKDAERFRKEMTESLNKLIAGLRVSLREHTSEVIKLKKEAKKSGGRKRRAAAAAAEQASGDAPKKERKESGITKKVAVSSELTSFMGLAKGSLVSRTDASSFILGYMKKHNLQNTEGPKVYRPDDAVQKLLRTGAGQTLRVPDIAKLIGVHFPPSASKAAATAAH